MYPEAPIKPRNKPLTEAPCDKKLNQKLFGTRPKTIRKGARNPNRTKKNPITIDFLLNITIFLEQPT
jgi:hypothetical protein